MEHYVLQGGSSKSWSFVLSYLLTKNKGLGQTCIRWDNCSSTRSAASSSWVCLYTVSLVVKLTLLQLSGAEDAGLLAIGTILYNVVDSPVGILPVSHVDPSKDHLEDAWTTEKYGAATVDHELYKSKKPLYDPQAMAGMPIGIQVVGRKYEDEKVIAMMRILDQALGSERGFGPGILSARLRASKDS